MASEIGKNLMDKFENKFGIHLGVADRAQLLKYFRSFDSNLEEGDFIILALDFLPKIGYESEELRSRINWLKDLSKAMGEDYLERYFCKNGRD